MNALETIEPPKVARPPATRRVVVGSRVLVCVLHGLRADRTELLVYRPAVVHEVRDNGTVLVTWLHITGIGSAYQCSGEVIYQRAPAAQTYCWPGDVIESRMNGLPFAMLPPQAGPLAELEQPESECCGAAPSGEIHETGGVWMGLCSGCKDHASFTEGLA